MSGKVTNKKLTLPERYGSSETPVKSYGFLLLAYNLLLLQMNKSVFSKDQKNNELSIRDFLLLAPATHKLSRIITKDWVTIPFRAPFVKYQGSAGGGEVREKSRGKGLQKAIGDLLTCPYCIGPWVAAGLMYGFKKKPDETRLFASIFTLVAASDLMHFTYFAAKKRAGIS